ncbi:archease, partial [Thermodesulfobacteriota bacterium]
MMKYKSIDHTADFGIHVFGSNAEDLFANAAFALFDLITEMDAVKGLDARTVHIKGDDWPDLMVNWLRELLYLWSGKELLVKKTDILAISQNDLSATVLADPYNPDRHVINAEI